METKRSKDPSTIQSIFQTSCQARTLVRGLIKWHTNTGSLTKSDAVCSTKWRLVFAFCLLWSQRVCKSAKCASAKPTHCQRLLRFTASTMAPFSAQTVINLPTIREMKFSVSTIDTQKKRKRQSSKTLASAKITTKGTNFSTRKHVPLCVLPV